MNTTLARVIARTVNGPATITPIAALGLTPTEVTLPAGACSERLVKLTNGHATNSIAWVLVKADAAAPTVTADFTASAGTIVGPGKDEWVAFDVGFDLWVVASAVSTPVLASAWNF